MGIRLHKAIGYGLTDIESTADGTGLPVLADDRIDPTGYLVDPVSAEFSFDNYCKFVQHFKWAVPTTDGGVYIDSPYPELHAINHGDLKLAGRLFHRSCNYDGEFGFSDTVLIVPPSLTSWHRYDDTIDYVEETLFHRQKNRVVELPVPPYPWNSSREWMPERRRVADGDAAILSDAEPGRSWRWIVPAEIAAICKFLRLFKDDETIRNLKPLLYVWWS